MKRRTLRLYALLETYSSDDLQKLFAGRMRYGESFNQICETFLIPYNLTAQIVGWNRVSKTFSKPYRPQVPTMPPKCVKPAISLPAPDGGNADTVI